MKNKLLASITVGVSLLVTTFFTYADQQLDLYSSSVLVPDQSSQVRDQALANGLANVFVRISGNRNIVKYAAVQRAIANANAYLYEFEYASTEETVAADGAEQSAVRLLMRFSPSLVDGLLQNEQLPYWPANRPDILLWAAQADGRGSQQFIGNDSAAVNALTLTAKERGITLIKPVFDLEDRLALPVSRLWIEDAASITNASSRYKTDAVLAGRFSPLDKGRWMASFTLFYQSRQQSFVSRGADIDKVSKDIFDQAADYLSSFFTTTINNEGSLETMALTVNNVDNFAIYADVLSYLEGLSTVQKVSLMTVQANQMKLMLHYQGSQAVILRNLSLDKRLVSVGFKPDANTLIAGDITATPVGTVDDPLQFLWQRQ